MVKDSIYRPIYERREKRLNVGFDYRGKILKRTLSSQLFNVNKVLSTFISKVDMVVYEWIESVKRIKIHANPALDKYENKIR